MPNACHLGPSAMISDLNHLCYHHYIYVLDPILPSHMHLLRVMIRKPGVTIVGILFDDDRSLRSSCTHHVLMLCFGSLLKGGLNIP